LLVNALTNETLLYSVTIGVAMQTSSRPLVLRQAHFFFTNIRRC